MDQFLLIDLHRRFLSDRRINSLISEIATIYSVSIPHMVINTTQKTFELRYAENVEFEVNRIRSIIKATIETDYPELVSYEVTLDLPQEKPFFKIH